VIHSKGRKQIFHASKLNNQLIPNGFHPWFPPNSSGNPLPHWHKFYLTPAEVNVKRVSILTLSTSSSYSFSFHWQIWNWERYRKSQRVGVFPVRPSCHRTSRSGLGKSCIGKSPFSGSKRRERPLRRKTPPRPCDVSKCASTCATVLPQRDDWKYPSFCYTSISLSNLRSRFKLPLLFESVGPCKVQVNERGRYRGKSYVEFIKPQLLQERPQTAHIIGDYFSPLDEKSVTFKQIETTQL